MQGAYSAAAQNTASGRSDPVAAGRAVALTVLEGALCAAHKPLTVLLPAAATLYAVKEVRCIAGIILYGSFCLSAWTATVEGAEQDVSIAL